MRTVLSARILLMTYTMILCAAVSHTSLAQEVLWSYTPSAGSVDTSPGIGDINGDGQPEIILATTAGVIVAIDHKAKEVWHAVKSTTGLSPQRTIRLSDYKTI